MSSGGTVIVLAAGQGTRMKSARPKVLHPLCGRPMLAWVLDRARALDPDRILVVVGHGAAEVRDLVDALDDERLVCVLQEPQLGTGHAVKVCAPLIPEDTRRVVVLYGDMPLLEDASLATLLDAQEAAGDEGCALLTCFPDETRGFGRIVRDEDDTLRAIVEEKDATPDERAIPEVNVGVYAFGARAILPRLSRLEAANAQNEYYLTDVVAMLVGDGCPVSPVVLEDPDEAIGVNTLAHLAEARWLIQARILEEHMEAGVFVEDPATTYVDHGVEIGPGTRILPCTVIRSGVRIGAGCEVGPFTHLRTGTELADGAEVGNFTECKKSFVGPGSKAKHLSYLGDARIGARVNIGAGTIFANYDGRAKHVSTVGDGAFVGSGTIVVAPNEIGAGATTGAGAVVTRGARIREGEVWVGVPARPLARSSQHGAGGEGAGEA